MRYPLRPFWSLIDVEWHTSQTDESLHDEENSGRYIYQETNAKQGYERNADHERDGQQEGQGNIPEKCRLGVVPKIDIVEAFDKAPIIFSW